MENDERKFIGILCLAEEAIQLLEKHKKFDYLREINGYLQDSLSREEKNE